MIKSVRAGAAGLLLALALAAPAAAAGPVSVRVEGQSATLLPRTTVSPPDRPEPVSGCPATSAANALDTATAANWDHQPFASTILGESHTFTANDYWAIWVFRGGRYVVSNGLCDEPLAAGEELLAAYETADPVTFAPQVFPIWIEGVPAVSAPGRPFTVTVRQTACETTFCNPGEGHAVARQGATVTAGGSAAVSDADGRATLTPSGAGPVTVRATGAGATPSAAEQTCLTDGTDGRCGSVTPAAQAPCATSGSDGLCGTRDTTPAAASIRGITDGRRFSRRKAPRTLTATVAADAGGLTAVKLGLSRSYKGRCWTWSGKQERFRRAKCGHHANFVVGKTADVSYLLPRRLGPGRYVLDVIAIDGAFNRDKLARGRNRVVFTVQ
jgi:hypothetical protein